MLKWSHVRTALADFLAPVLVGLLLPALALAGPPAWWLERQVIAPGQAANDYAAANQGQAKRLAKSAVEQMDAKLPGGAGAELHALIAGWATPGPQTNDYAPINLGQLKALAKPLLRPPHCAAVRDGLSLGKLRSSRQ